MGLETYRKMALKRKHTDISLFFTRTSDQQATLACLQMTDLIYGIDMVIFLS